MDFPIPPTPNDGLSIEGVAARAGVGKQTVYRWWASKSALVTEAVLDGRLPISGEPPPDTGDLRTDLGAWLTRQFKGMADPYVLSLIRAVTAAAADDATAGAALYERFTGPAHKQSLPGWRPESRPGKHDPAPTFTPRPTPSPAPCCTSPSPARTRPRNESPVYST
jgi:hypothetical protein